MRFNSCETNELKTLYGSENFNHFAALLQHKKSFVLILGFEG